MYYVNQKENVNSSASNSETEQAAYRIRINDPKTPVYGCDEVVLHPKKLVRGINQNRASQQSDPSTPIEGVQTEESNSVSGDVDDSSVSDDSNTLFSSVLNDLHSYTLVRDRQDAKESEQNHTNYRSGLSPEEEAIISMEICNENMAGLYGMAIHYPSGIDIQNDMANGFYDGEDIPQAPLDPSALWDGMLRVIQYFVTPTQKTLCEMREYSEKLYNDWVPVFHSSRFQVAVALTIVAVVTAAKFMHRDRVRNPLPIVRHIKKSIVSEQTLEKVFASLAAQRKSNNPFV